MTKVEDLVLHFTRKELERKAKDAGIPRPDLMRNKAEIAQAIVWKENPEEFRDAPKVVKNEEGEEESVDNSEMVEVEVLVSHLVIGGYPWHMEEKEYKRGDIITVSANFMAKSLSVRGVREI